MCEPEPKIYLNLAQKIAAFPSLIFLLLELTPLNYGATKKGGM